MKMLTLAGSQFNAINMMNGDACNDFEDDEVCVYDDSKIVIKGFKSLKKDK